MIMAAPFPNHPQLRGNFAPVNFEAQIQDLVVDGSLPKGLAGSLYRNGPNPKYAPTGPYHWFGGDGMVHAFHFNNGRVDYLNRWVETPKHLAELAEGKSIPRVRKPDPVSGKLLSDNENGLANTHIIWHADKLLALDEGSHPFELEPMTLESKGYTASSSDLSGAMTAHPKIDPATGELHGFGYMTGYAGSPIMSYHVVDKAGVVLRSDEFETPFPAMVHDFVLTDDYVLFPIFPLTFDMERAAKIGSPYAFDAAKGTHIGVLKRGAPVSDIRWIEGPICFVFHYMNGWNEGEKITIDTIEFAVAPNFPLVDGSLPSHAQAQGKLVRWHINLKNGDVSQEPLLDVASEFPRFDERFVAGRYKHGYIAAASKRQRGDGGLFHEITHINLDSGLTSTWDAGTGNGVSEPVFVPDSKGAAEGEGWLLATVYKEATKNSDLVVLNAQAVQDGPVATVCLDHRVPFGFHGSWRPGMV
jgi:carotenoid cleavage dioxygenase-like enzyme